MRKKMTFLAILIISIVLAAGSVIYQNRKASRCDYDGTKIVPQYKIAVILENGETMNFCSLHCARGWSLKNRLTVQWQSASRNPPSTIRCPHPEEELRV